MGGSGGASSHVPSAGEGRAPPVLPKPPVIAIFPAMGDVIAITVNGEARQMPAGATVASLLTQLGLDTRKVAVERNLEIVPRSSYATTALAAGDQLEIVHFIGGG